jgi:hypothetical protein
MKQNFIHNQQISRKISHRTVVVIILIHPLGAAVNEFHLLIPSQQRRGGIVETDFRFVLIRDHRHGAVLGVLFADTLYVLRDHQICPS